MKILYVASEAAPFIKTGGLGDVAGDLPKALAQLGADIRVVIPFYQAIPEQLRKKATFITSFKVPLAWREQYCGLFRLDEDKVTYYFLDNEYYFHRKTTYGAFDDAERFAFFSKGVLEMIQHVDFYPDVIHCNDWHTGLVPIYLSLYHPEYQDIKTLFTIHNIGYQGIYGRETVHDVFGIDEKHLSILEYDRGYNIMKGAIQTAHMVTTVSKTYAKELLEPFYAHGLEHILDENQYKLKGIVNGIDIHRFDPERDTHLFHFYSKNELEYKRENKIELQKFLQLPEDPDIPMIGMISRLTGHKGVDLVSQAAPEILENDVQFVLLGQGDWQYETIFQELERAYPAKLRAIIAFSNDMASKIYGGSDMFLMPSKSEPCGLAQMIAMRYGTIPIVRETGGLKDTVKAYNPQTKKGNGVTFQSYRADDMKDAVYRSLDLYGSKKDWDHLIQNAMKTDVSWKRSAKAYIKEYQKIMKV